jgi:hypothetical protein
MLWMFNFITIWVLNLVTEFEWKMENKNILWKRSLVDQEQHLALEMPTSEMAHVGREGERENTPAKQHQGKAWETKAQQDLPINMAINSRLLPCKVE